MYLILKYVISVYIIRLIELYRFSLLLFKINNSKYFDLLKMDIIIFIKL